MVGVKKVCEFSTGSVLCLCIVTWNMNGKVFSKDLAKLVGKDRKFDLFVVGLQEVPRHNVSGMLQSALAETHRYMSGNFINTFLVLVSRILQCPVDPSGMNFCYHPLDDDGILVTCNILIS